MSFSFQVLSEEEINAINLIEEGVYGFEVVQAIQDVSKSSGNPMVKLQLKIFDRNGNVHTIYDYLVSAERMLYKIKHFCEAVGMEYSKGSFDVENCLYKSGQVHIIIQKAKDGYPAKNSVRDYIPIDKDAVETIKRPAKKDDVPFDDVPFTDSDVPF